MGVLDEIQKNTITAKLAAVAPVTAEPQTVPVVSPQPVPPPPLDRAAKNDLLARIRQTYPAAVQAATAGTAQQPAVAPTNPSHKEVGPTPVSPPDAKPAPFVPAVWEPAGFRGPRDPGGYFFDDSVSQAERKEFVEAVDWFERAAARKKQEAEKNSAPEEFQELKF